MSNEVHETHFCPPYRIEGEDIVGTSKRKPENPEKTRQDVRNFICEVLNMHTGQSWIPIADAPKDGTWILTIVSDKAAGGFSYIPTTVHWVKCKKDFRDFTIQEEGWNNGETTHIGYSPDFWLPLPPSPNGLPYLD